MEVFTRELATEITTPRSC